MDELEKNKMEINNTKMPVGSIISWVSKVNKVNKAGSVELPKGWMRCDGSLIAEVGMSHLLEVEMFYLNSTLNFGIPPV